MKAADAGNLVIKEFDNMPMEFQNKLESALKNKKFYKLGDINPIEIDDIKFILIGKKDVRVKVAKGKLSELLLSYLIRFFQNTSIERPKRRCLLYS